MVTTVGINTDFEAVLKSLIRLDFDAIEAYEAAIDRLENAQFKQKLVEFCADHLRHVQDLSAILRNLGREAPTEPDLKALITKGKVVMADMLGDQAILMAMKSNEEDTNTAYERALHHEDMLPAARLTVERGLADERRHREWLKTTIESMS